MIFQLPCRTKFVWALFSALGLLGLGPALAFGTTPPAYFSGVVAFGKAGSAPVAVAEDAQGNLYITDQAGGQVIKQTPAGVQSAVASGLSFPSTSGTPGLAVDASGNVYIGESNALVKAAPASGTYTLSTIATGIDANGVAVDAAGNVFLASTSGSGEVVEYQFDASTEKYNTTPHTIASGTGADGVAVDASGNVYVSYASQGTVVKFTPASGGAYTQSDVTTALSYPLGLAVDAAGDVYVADDSLAEVVKETPVGSSYAESTMADMLHDGLQLPTGVALDAAGDVFIADSSVPIVLEVPVREADFGASTIGSAAPALSLRFTVTSGATLGAPIALTEGAAGLDFSVTAGTCTGSLTPGQSCTLTATFTPSLAGWRRGAIELMDNGGNVLATAPLSGTGNGPQVSFAPGSETAIGGTVNLPTQAVVNGSGDLFVATTAGVLEEAPSGGTYTQSALGTGETNPLGVAVDGAGNVYISDTGNGRILEETPAAGSFVQSVLVSGLSSPGAIAVDGGGNLYVAQSTGIIRETLQFGSYVPSAVAALTLPASVGLAVSGDGTVFAGDPGQSAILEAVPANGVYTTQLLGQGTFTNPTGLTLDAAGNLYVYDASNQQVAMLSAASSYATATVVGKANSPALAVDASGNVYWEGSSVQQMARLDRSTAPNLTFAAAALGAQSKQTFSLFNLGTAALTLSAISNPASSFSVSGCSVGVLANGTACTETVTFAPQVLGSTASSFAFTDDNLGTAGAQQTVSLSGSGLAAPLTITASSATVELGSAIPAITPIYAGFVNGNTATSLTTAPTCATTATSSSPIGAYATTCSGAVDSNYTFTYVSGTITITKLTAQTITFGALPAVTYGTKTVALSASSSSGLTPTLQLISGPATLSGTTLTITGAGTVVVEATQAGNSTYAPATPVTQSLTVAPAPLTITASSGSIEYGAPLPVITPTYAGFVNGDTAASLTTAPVCGTGVTSTTGTGDAYTTCSGAVDSNYTITYATGVLVISPATVSVTLTASASSITAGQSVTLTATVSSATGAMPPGGVQFFDQATGAEIGVGNLNNGQATFTATLSSVTTVTIYAVYIGGGNFTSGQSADVSVQVLAPTVTSGFSMSLSDPTISLEMLTINDSQQDTITLTPISGYHAAVTLSCSLPSGLAVSCTFPGGATLNLTGQPGTATVKFEVVDQPAALLTPGGWLGGGSGWKWLWVLLGLLGALLGGWWLLPQRKHKLAWSMAVAGVVLVACAQSAPVTTPTQVPATITATGVAAAGSGYANHSETRTVTLVLKGL